MKKIKYLAIYISQMAGMNLIYVSDIYNTKMVWFREETMELYMQE